jgi:hypothetical protein
LFRKDNVSKQIAAGVTTASGECVLTADEKKSLWQAIHQRPGHVWLLSGTMATQVAVSSLVGATPELNKRDVLDGLNFAASADDLDSVQMNTLIRWAEENFGEKLLGNPKKQTEI